MSWTGVRTVVLRVFPKTFLDIPVARTSMTDVTVSRYSNRSTWRWLSTKQVSSPSCVSKVTTKQVGPKHGFVTIYKFPLIVTVSRINIARRLHMMILPIAAPLSLVLTFAGVVPFHSSMLFCCVGVVVAIKLYLAGLVATNFVGYVYTNGDTSIVQIAYVDDAGRRKEDIFPVSDLVPLSEVPANTLKQLYTPLYRYSKPSSRGLYKINLSHGKITDMDRFTTIFGKVD